MLYNDQHMNNLENVSFFRKNAIWLIVLAALVVFGFLLFKGWDKIINDEIDGMVTITGNFGCRRYWRSLHTRSQKS